MIQLEKKTSVFTLSLVSSLAIAGLCAAQDAVPAEEPGTLVEALSSGKLDFNLRLRAEWVDQDGFDSSDAYTERIRIGYGTKPFHGLSFYIGFEDVRSFDYDAYNAAGLNGQPGKAVVADPEDTELDQLFVRYAIPDRNIEFTLGRQRLVVDDHRFVGNVGWRQLEQTFDAVTTRITPAEHFKVMHSYLWEINRIFGPDAGRDWESDSHLINISYDGWSFGTVTGFAYLLDFDNAPASSSDTFGVRLTGSHAFNEDWSLGYAASFAHQSDGGNNPTDYDAEYYFGELSLTKKDLGTAGVGYEVLGSDDGMASFQTPLATGHKFNGWADAFLTTPPAGLEDLYLFAKTTLPWKIKGGVYYHWFEAEDGGGDFGEELDIVLSKKLNNHWTVLAKYSDLNGDGGVADREKIWLQTEFSF